MLHLSKAGTAGHSQAGPGWSTSWLIVEGYCSDFLTKALNGSSSGTPTPSVPTQDRIAAVVGDEGRNVASKTGDDATLSGCVRRFQCHTYRIGGSRRRTRGVTTLLGWSLTSSRIDGV